jgi:hypothetical protein
LPIRSSSMLTRSPTRRRARLVTASVCGMISTASQVSRTSATVRLTPLSATEPRVTMNLRHSRSRKVKVKRELPSLLLMERRRTVPSMWPLTMWPPRKSFMVSGSSMLRGEPTGLSCRLESFRVGVARLKRSKSFLRSITVRQMPSTASESPTAGGLARATRTVRTGFFPFSRSLEGRCLFICF